MNAKPARYRWPIAALLLMTGLMPAAHAGTALDAIRARGELRVGTTGDYKPFTFREPDGSYQGADITMAKELAQKLGVRLEIVPTTWKTLLGDFVAGRFDVAMGGVSINPERSEKGTFSVPTSVDGKRPIARCADAGRFTSIAAIDRPDVRVVVNPGGSNEQFAHANFPHAQLVVHSDNATIFDEIVAGRADVMVTDGIEADHQAVITKTLCATYVLAPFTRLEKAYLLPKDSELEKLVDDWLRDAERSGHEKAVLDAALAER